MLQHRARFRTSTLLQTIKRLSRRLRLIERANRPNLDLQHLRQSHQSIEVNNRIPLPHQSKDAFAVKLIILLQISEEACAQHLGMGGLNITTSPSPRVRLGEATISLGNGNNDIVMASQTADSEITVGNGNDTIYVGRNNTVTVGTGHDSFIFEQTTPGNIGAVTVNHFDPNKDIFTFSTQLTSSVSYHDNAQGNAVVTVDNAGDTVTLVGVHPSELHPSNFHFVDPAAVPAIATTAQMVADLHAHNIL
jgi:hypothetical protein